MMQTSQQDEQKYSVEAQRCDIERAIETISAFSLSNSKRSIPSLEPFDIQDGTLLVHPRSSFEKTVAFTKSFVTLLSPYYRSQQKEKRKAIVSTLQESVELIKIYSSALGHMQNGTPSDQALARKLLQAANTFNTVVRQIRQPSSLKSKIKQFFVSIAGWQLDDEWLGVQIHVPEVVEKGPRPDLLLGHKVTVQKDNRLSGLLEAVHRTSQQDKLKPKKEEVDVFRLKAQGLLRDHKEQTGLSEAEVIELVQMASIESHAVDKSYGYATSAVSFSAVICPLPGETIELRGDFLRDSFHSELCFPIKNSFKLYMSASQTGFARPLQYIGFGLHEKLIPTFLLRPKACPGIQSFLEKNRTVSHELIHNQLYRQRARERIGQRRLCFDKNPSLILALEKMLGCFAEKSGVADARQIGPFFDFAQKMSRPFDFISSIHEEVVVKTVSEPLDRLQQEWLFNHNPDISDPSYCRQVLDEGITSVQQTFSPHEHPLIRTYQKQLSAILQPAVTSLFLVQLSEHLGFLPHTPSRFDEIVLASLIRQQLVFIQELEGSFSDSEFEAHFMKLFVEQAKLFSDEATSDPITQKAWRLTGEFLEYFAIV